MADIHHFQIGQFKDFDTEEINYSNNIIEMKLMTVVLMMVMMTVEMAVMVAMVMNANMVMIENLIPDMTVIMLMVMKTATNAMSLYSAM